MYNQNTYSVEIFVKRISSIVDDIAKKKRLEMVACCLKPSDEFNLDLNQVTSILDVGTTADERFASSNIILNSLARPGVKITTFSDQKIDKDQFPEFSIVEMLNGDITNCPPFQDNYDLVIASALLEHVGDFNQKRRAVQNLIAASSKYILVTIPNRWHPIEFHSRIPLVHWLPNSWWRNFYSLIGMKQLSDPSSLDFISPKSILEFAKEFDSEIHAKIMSVRLLGFKSNYVILFEKNHG
jgi:hypothetical protein